MPGLPTYTTRFGSLADYEKGEIELIDDDPKHYAFSNIFEVAAQLEALREGRRRQEHASTCSRRSAPRARREWRTAPHDEFALVMDGEVEIHLRQARRRAGGPTAGRDGSIALDGRAGRPADGHGHRAGRGHMTLLPAGAAYQFHAERPSRDPAPDHRRARHRRPLGRHLQTVPDDPPRARRSRRSR